RWRGARRALTRIRSFLCARSRAVSSSLPGALISHRSVAARAASAAGLGPLELERQSPAARSERNAVAHQERLLAGVVVMAEVAGAAFLAMSVDVMEVSIAIAKSRLRRGLLLDEILVVTREAKRVRIRAESRVGASRMRLREEIPMGGRVGFVAGLALPFAKRSVDVLRGANLACDVGDLLARSGGDLAIRASEASGAGRQRGESGRFRGVPLVADDARSFRCESAVRRVPGRRIERHVLAAREAEVPRCAKQEIRNAAAV